MGFCLFRRNCPCKNPVVGLQGREPVQREKPEAGSRIRNARCGAHVHTVQRMRNASCEYGHGSSSFRLNFHLGLTAIVHQGRRFGFTGHVAPGRGFSRSRKTSGAMTLAVSARCPRACSSLRSYPSGCDKIGLYKRFNCLGGALYVELQVVLCLHDVR